MTTTAEPTSSARAFALPNLLTYARIAAVPVVVGCMYLQSVLGYGLWLRWVALFIFIAAGITAARHAGVPADAGIEALAKFENVKRRMEVRGVANGITVYDDFAHHPTAIATTVAGLRGKVGGARILAVLEPRSNTMKLGVMKDALPGSLKDADRVYCYGANLGWDAGAVLAPLGDKAAAYDDLAALVEAVAAAARPGDHVLVMSNGGFGGVHEKLLAALAR